MAPSCSFNSITRITFSSSRHTTPLCRCAGENWTAAKKASDPSTSRLPSLSDTVNPVNALNGVFKRLLTLGDLNLYNYAAGMPALYGTANSYRNGQVDGTSLPKLEEAAGLQRKANGVSKDSVQV